MYYAAIIMYSWCLAILFMPLICLLQMLTFRYFDIEHTCVRMKIIRATRHAHKLDNPWDKVVR
jgi:hypothetical protein